MSEPDGRYAVPHGSTAFPGTPLPGQPLSEQPTEVVPPVEYHPRHESAAGPAYGYAAPPAADTDPGFWAQTADPRDDDGYAGDDDGVHLFDDDGTATQPEYGDAPVVVRRAESIAGLLLLLAGIAAGVSLLVVWSNGGVPGLDLLRAGLDDLSGDPQRLADRDTWEPLAVVLGGGALFVLGLLMFVPAKTHRFLGALALLVTLVVAAGVLVPLADANWELEPWAVGAWFTVAVGGLGFLGALKALMTGPKAGRLH